MKAGVIDPAKVVRSALQNAASIASLLLTTEAVISQAPDDHKATAAAQARRHGRRDVLAEWVHCESFSRPIIGRRWSSSSSA